MTALFEPVPANIRALSLSRPWSDAILRLNKRLENRSVRTSFRGRFLLHSAKSFDDEGDRYIVKLGFNPQACPIGAIVGEAEICGCMHVEEWRRFNTCEECQSGQDVWAFGPFVYTLDSVIAYPEPIFCRGALGFWRVPVEVVAAINSMREAKP
jgi:hypothetical protein